MYVFVQGRVVEGRIIDTELFVRVCRVCCVLTSMSVRMCRMCCVVSPCVVVLCFDLMRMFDSAGGSVPCQD